MSIHHTQTKYTTRSARPSLSTTDCLQVILQLDLATEESHKHSNVLLYFFCPASTRILYPTTQERTKMEEEKESIDDDWQRRFSKSMRPLPKCSTTTRYKLLVWSWSRSCCPYAVRTLPVPLNASTGLSSRYEKSVDRTHSSPPFPIAEALQRSGPVRSVCPRLPQRHRHRTHGYHERLNRTTTLTMPAQTKSLCQAAPAGPPGPLCAPAGRKS